MAFMFACPLVSLLAAVVILSQPEHCYAGPIQGRRQKRPPVLQTAPEKNDEEEVKDGDINRDLHGPVLKLNEHIFHGNVLRQTDDRVSHWVVYWCPAWFEPCQGLMQKYAEESMAWQTKLNAGSLLSLQVRFARVDCATDKPLCNEMGVEDYPTVQHYHLGQKVSTFVGRFKNPEPPLQAWLAKELDDIGFAPSPTASIQENISRFLVPGDRALDIAVVLLLLAVNFWAVARNPDLWQKASVMAPVSQLPAPETAAPAAEVLAPEELQPPSTVDQLMPQEWLRHRGDGSGAAAMEL